NLVACRAIYPRDGPAGPRRGSPLAHDPPVAEYRRSPRNIKTSGTLDQVCGNDRSAGPAR
ncbi:MAG: hypothetical protein WB800_23110, partial [Streptosporangiaceae bacterium]